MKLAVVLVASCLATQVSCLGLRAAGGSKDNLHNTKDGGVVQRNDALQKAKAKQGSNRTFSAGDCEIDKVYSKESGQYAWVGKRTNAAECVAECQSRDSAYTHYNFYPQCKLAGKDNNGKCGCMCSKSETDWIDKSEYVADGYGYVSGPLNCDRCAWTCKTVDLTMTPGGANCASCEKVDRMESTYYGDAGGDGSISWTFPDSGIMNFRGFCFKPQQTDKDIDLAFITGDGDEKGQESLSSYTYSAGDKICYVTRAYAACGGTPGYCKFLTRLYIEGSKVKEDNFDYQLYSAGLGTRPTSLQMKFVGGDAAVSDLEYHQFPWGTACCDDSTKASR